MLTDKTGSVVAVRSPIGLQAAAYSILKQQPIFRDAAGHLYLKTMLRNHSDQFLINKDRPARTITAR
jgi:hypothetical protein